MNTHKIIEVLKYLKETEKKGYDLGNIEAEQYIIISKFFGDFKEFFKIRGIPYYVILDKSGDIYDPKAKWPHHVKLKNSIDLLLKIDP